MQVWHGWMRAILVHAEQVRHAGWACALQGVRLAGVTCCECDTARVRHAGCETWMGVRDMLGV